MATIGRADFVAEGEAAQRAAIVRLTAADSGPAALPLGTDQAVYVENIAPAAAARLGRVVDDPADADLAVLRLNAPYEPRPGGFESFFHAGSLEFPAAERDRIVAICEQVPTIIVLFLDRPAIVPEIADAAAALLVEFGARDDAVVDVLLGAGAGAGAAAVRPSVVHEGRDREPQRRPVRHGRPAVPIRRRHRRLTPSIDQFDSTTANPSMWTSGQPARPIEDGVPTMQAQSKKYQAKAPKTQAFGAEAFDSLWTEQSLDGWAWPDS